MTTHTVGRHVAPPAAPTTPTLTRPRTASASPRALLGVARHLLIPLFLVTGMALAYLGAFHQPTPHDLRTAVVGSDARAQVFAQKLTDGANGALAVTTVGSADEAQRQIRERKLAGAYQVLRDHAVLYVARGDSATTASALSEVFGPIAYAQHQPLEVRDVVPVGPQDRSGQGLFFLLVALSIGGYTGAIAVSAAAAHLHVAVRALVSVALTAVVSAIGVVVAGPVYGVITTGHLAIWALAWLYTAGITVLGVGLHPVFKKWTTPLLTMLFVMLNFTSSGGVFTAELMPRFFAALHSFWDGAAWLQAAQSELYFGGADLSRPVLTLAAWFVVALAVTALTHSWSVHRVRVADEEVEVGEEEEGVVVA